MGRTKTTGEANLLIFSKERIMLENQRDSQIEFFHWAAGSKHICSKTSKPGSVLVVVIRKLQKRRYQQQKKREKEEMEPKYNFQWSSRQGKIVKCCWKL